MAQSIVGLGAIFKVERGNASSVSDDGSIVGGTVWQMQGQGSTKACVWRRQQNGTYEREMIGTLFTGRSQLAGVSSDGSTITISYSALAWPEPQATYYRCLQIAPGIRVWGQLLPFLDGTQFALDPGSSDGVTYAGVTINGLDRRAFIWSTTPGSPPPQILPPLPGFDRSMAHDASRDWRVIVGRSVSGSGQEELVTPTRWVHGVPEEIAAPPGYFDASATEVSADGTAMIGYAGDGRRMTVGVLWREGHAPVVIRGPRDAAITVPYAVSGDGSTVVGWSRNDRYIGYIDRPWLWTLRTGTLDLNELVGQLGGGFTNWRVMNPSFITPDGQTLVGGGFHNGLYESYVMTLPELCPADFDNDGDTANGGMPNFAVGVEDLVYFLAQFEVGDAHLDLDDGSGTGQGDNAVTIDDLLYFLTHFEAGC